MKSLLLVALSFPIFAADEAPLIVNHDVRLTVSALPRPYDVTITNTQTGDVVHGTGSLDSGAWVALDYQASLHHEGPVCFLIGAGLDFVGGSLTDDTTKADVSGFGPHIAIGASVRPVGMFSIEGTLEGGFGAADSTIKDNSQSLDVSSNSGSYGMFAALVRGVVTFDPGFQLFAQFGYAAFAFKTSYNATATTFPVDQDSRVRGVTYGLGAGWRF